MVTSFNKTEDFVIKNLNRLHNMAAYQPQYPHPAPQVQNPVMLQPAPVANVVVNAGGVVERKPRDWDAGIFGCCDDVGIMCAVCFCPACYLCYLSDKMGESLCMPIFVPMAVMALRIKLRSENNIKGSILDDCCKVYCCPTCTLCQLGREHQTITKMRMSRI